MLQAIATHTTRRAAKRAASGDPIFAAIGEFKAANKRRLKSLEPWSGPGIDGVPPAKWPNKDWRALSKQCDAAWDVLVKAMDRLIWRTKPTTDAGMTAWLGYVARFDNPTLFWGHDYDGSHDEMSRLLRHIRKSLKGIQAAA